MGKYLARRLLNYVVLVFIATSMAYLLAAVSLNPRAHYEATGPEIWRQTGGKVTHFVAGVGTGGTISGVARCLKEQNPAVRVVGADPEGSIYTSQTIHTYKVEGVGEDFWPGTFDRSLVDEFIQVTDRDSFLTARRVTREEGILIGGSGGLAVWAALQVARGADDPNALQGKSPGQLAASVESSDLGQRLLIRIRSGTVWSDGSRPVSANDVAHALIDRSDPHSPSYEARWAELVPPYQDLAANIG